MSDSDRVWDLMKKIDFCMLVTHVGKGLRSRPMSTIVEKEERCIYMLTHMAEMKDDEIAENPNVLLNYVNGSDTFVSVSGKATLTNDRMLVKRLWSPGAQAFWPQGPDDPEIWAIRVSPGTAEYWEGDNKVVSTVKFAIALATGTSPHPGENKKVML